LFTNDDVLKSISILSGGEKVRLVLLLLMLSNPDLLILDEPTNHLDIETKDIIEDVFNEFTGPILFVSHDRYFINKIGTKIIHLSEDSMIEFEGTYDEFKESIKLKTNKKIQKKNKTNMKKSDNNKEVKNLEKTIHAIEQKIKELENESYQEVVFTDYKKINEINKLIEELKDELKIIYERYYKLLDI